MDRQKTKHPDISVVNQTGNGTEASNKPVSQSPPIGLPSTEEEQNALGDILKILYDTFRIDFAHYRQTTVLRRLSRRMSICKCDRFATYRDYLNDNRLETEQLYDDLLLSFTEFFRDPPVFDALKERVFPCLTENRSPRTPIRIWVPGCSTGEEVYSLAICLQEFLEDNRLNASFQFFGTDLVPRHIEKARIALYSEKIRQNISEERLNRFFDLTEHGFQVAKHLRDTCIFAVQNVTQDPPFPRIDLVSCRNVLIYFDEAFQKNAIPLFHFALNPRGFLLLGTSETLEKFPSFFTAIDTKVNLFAKQTTPVKPEYPFPASVQVVKSPSTDEILTSRTGRETQVAETKQRIDQLLIDMYAPPGVLVDSHLQILQFRGATSRYLEPLTGEASFKLSKMARPGLMPDLALTVEEARKTQTKACKKKIPFKYNTTTEWVDVSVVPVGVGRIEITHFLILFEESKNPIDPLPIGARSPEHEDELMGLQQELRLTKAHLQSIVEEKDDVNQELWAANQEIQSTNEELQSVNEEMEAAKEELESGNEELSVINEELHASNQELVAAKEFAENLLETANTIVVTLDAEANIILFNRYAETLTGYAKDDVIGKNWFRLFIPKRDHGSIPKVFKDVLGQMPEVSQYNNPIETRTGEERLIAWRNNVLRDQTGAINGVLSIGTDITEQKKAQEELRQSEHLLRKIAENYPRSYLSIINRDYTIGFTSGQEFQRQNIDPAAFAGLTIGEVFGDSTPTVREHYEKTFRGEEQSFELSQNSQHQYYRTVPLHGEDGSVERILVVVENITDRKKAEQALRESESRFRSYVESAPDGIFVADENGCSIDVNDAACRITGYTRDELIGMPLTHLNHPEDIENAKKHFGDVATKGHASGEFRLIAKDKTIRHWMVDAVKLSDTRFLGFTKDITENKQFEEQLRQSAKMQAVGQLAGGIAHDFNNQLSGILNYTELIQDKVGDNETLNRYASNILRGVKRAADLTSQLLAFSRKGKYQNTHVDVHRIVFEVVNLLQHSIDKKVVIHQNLKANPAATLGDPTQLQNAILNLALNARDAMPNGGTLTFETDVVTFSREATKAHPGDLQPREYLRLRVSDTGIGMDNAIKQRIFEPFFTTKQPGKGTGMGLAAVYGTIVNHGGSVSVESTPGQGATFALHLPLISGEVYDEREAQPQKPISGKGRILLVEDEEMIREVATEMLTQLGYTVSQCTTGKEAVDFYRENWKTVDLVVLDIIMPVMGGEEAFSKMRDINPDIKVLLSSGYSIDGKARNLIEKGAKEFIQKPYRKADLSKKIADILGLQGSRKKEE